MAATMVGFEGTTVNRMHFLISSSSPDGNSRSINRSSPQNTRRATRGVLCEGGQLLRSRGVRGRSSQRYYLTSDLRDKPELTKEGHFRKREPHRRNSALRHLVIYLLILSGQM